MMNKKVPNIILLIILTLGISGCSLFMRENQNPVTNTGSMNITITLPKDLVPVKSKGALDGVTLSKVEFAISNGVRNYTKTVDVTGEVIEVAFANLQEGIWTVTVIAKDSDQYEVFKGTGTGRVAANKIIPIAVQMNMVLGSLNLSVSVPADLLELAKVKLIVANISTGESLANEYSKEQLLEPIIINDLSPTAWNIKLEAYDSTGNFLAKGTKVLDVKPGRVTTANVFFDVGGITIDTIWAMPPEKPKNIVSEIGVNQVKLKWDAVVGDVKGYLVARSVAVDGDVEIVSPNLITATEFVDNTPWKQSEYYYWVAAFDNKGLYSGWSGPILAKKKNVLNITIIGKGTVTKTPDNKRILYDYDSFVTLEAIPDEGHRFIGWQGDATGTGTFMLSMSSNKSITAVFEAITPLRVPEVYTSIQVAIDAAKEGDTIIVSPGTYDENIRFNGKSNLTLTSTNPLDPTVVENTIINGKQQGSCIVIENGERDIIISGLKIINGSGTNKEQSSLGGGISVYNGATVNLFNNIISNNKAIEGGGISVYNSTVTLTNNIIRDNTASSVGGGIFARYASIIISSCTISNNANYAGGGGGLALSYSTVDIKNSLISYNNTTPSAGGGVATHNSTVNIDKSTIIGNNSDGGAGGVCVFTSTVAITDTTISGNTSSGVGGGILNTAESKLILQNNIIKDNFSQYNGGGVFIYGSSTISNINNELLTTPQGVEAINEFSNNTPDNVYFKPVN